MIILTGKLKQNKVIVEDEKEGNQLYNKGYFGEPISGGGVELNIFEALYLLKQERLNVETPVGEEIDEFQLMNSGVDHEESFQKKYFVYEDMRRRGYVVKLASDPADFRIFPRGGGPGNTPSKYWIPTQQETEVFNIKNILDILNKVKNIKKKAMIGMVDCEGDVTYYKLSTIDLKGDVNIPDNKEIEGTFIDHRFILTWDGDEEDDCEIEDNKMIIDSNPSGKNDYELSFMETIFLMEKGLLSSENETRFSKLEEIRKEAEKNIGDFKMKYRIYKDLRDRNIIPKTGFKYGTTFRCYLHDPKRSHAQYLVRPISDEFLTSWYDVSRSVRLAHSVKKDFLFAVDMDEKVKYVEIKRETP